MFFKTSRLYSLESIIYLDVVVFLILLLHYSTLRFTQLVLPIFLLVCCLLNNALAIVMYITRDSCEDMEARLALGVTKEDFESQYKWNKVAGSAKPMYKIGNNEVEYILAQKMDLPLQAGLNYGTMEAQVYPTLPAQYPACFFKNSAFSNAAGEERRT